MAFTQPTAAAMLSLSEITKVFEVSGRTVTVLRGIDLHVRKGDYIAVTGPSGCGKSTLLSVLGGLDLPSSGRYLLEGRDMTTVGEDHLARIRNRRIGFVFQAFNLIPSLTIEENAEMALFYAHVPHEKRRRLACEALRMVGLGDRLGHLPTQLSGGEQQRVAIARALSMNPPLILADEPTGNLDSRTGQMILDIFKQLHAQGKTIIMVTHDAAIAGSIPRRVQLEDGLVLSDTAVEAQARA